MTESQNQNGGFKADKMMQNVIILFLIVTLTLNAVGLLWMGVLNGKIEFTGSIDAGVIVGVVVSVAIVTVLRYVFKKENV
ncbi:hypothetical protein [Candidatus Nitrososphaera gargensis]|uniref:hypothetical protein n=1 Tax=Candidatus Nitrososphaera gargensis TaxID=497727 RepID=UPI0011E518BA|nr:hypothetical protein [Candidatus Nitrososphaera gargensis]